MAETLELETSTGIAASTLVEKYSGHSVQVSKYRNTEEVLLVKNVTSWTRRDDGSMYISTEDGQLILSSAEVQSPASASPPTP